MRIIAGTHRSRSLIAPKGDKTRPTSDRARETVFNILINLTDIEDTSVLDLFAGTGAFAFEALSRGAASAVCIDNSKEAIEAITTNSKSLDLHCKILRTDVYKWLATAEGPYDIVFADPPYDDPNLPEILLKTVFSSRLLTPDSIVIIEHRTGTELSIPPNATMIRNRSAGEAQFTFFRLRGNETESSHLSGDLRSDHERTS